MNDVMLLIYVITFYVYVYVTAVGTEEQRGRLSLEWMGGWRGGWRSQS